VSIDTRKAGFLFAPALCLLAPLFVYLTSKDYPLLTSEVAILVGASALVGVVNLLLARHVSLSLAKIVVWLCLSFGVIAQYKLLTLYGAVFVVTMAAGLVVLARAKSGLIVAVAAGAHLASTLVMHVFLTGGDGAGTEAVAAAPAAHPGPDGPPVVHLLFDEFAGLHGLPMNMESARETRAVLTDFFTRNDFTVYPKAYSEYLRTRDSVPNLVNFRSSDKIYDRTFLKFDGNMKLVENEYFKVLTERGYEIDVYQTQYIDLCSTRGVAVNECRTYANFDPKSIRAANIGAWQRAVFLRNAALDASSTLRMLRLRYLPLQNRFPVLPDWRAHNGNPGPLTSRPAIEAVTERLRTISPGDAVFAHFMIPHFPYLHRSDCSVRPKVRDWLNRVPFEAAGLLDLPRHGTEEQNDENSRRVRYERYLEQLGCTKAIIEQFFDALRQSGHWDEAIVVIHGDHATRIFRRLPNTRNVDQLTGEDFRDAFSTFYAAKTPFLDAGTVPDALPLQLLLARSFDIPEPEIAPGFAYLSNWDKGTLVRTPLQGF